MRIKKLTTNNIEDYWDIFLTPEDERKKPEWEEDDFELSSLPAFDEDNSLAKLKDFWPKTKMFSSPELTSAA